MNSDIRLQAKLFKQMSRLAQLECTIVLAAAVVLLLAASSALAQTLRGTVVGVSGVAIAGAHVTVQSATRTASLRSSSEGTFDTQLISPPATITASAPGFAAATTAWNGEPRVDPHACSGPSAPRN